ncbi:MAG: ribosome maturation factor RimM [Ignavibacteria bacterium]|nr:ribosome maturation factor RimM [Ignavibacteria bacterium]
MIGFSLLGKIISVHGMSGDVKVKIFDDTLEEIDSLDFCFVDFFGNKKKLSVLSAKFSGKFLVLSLEGFGSKEASSILVDKELFIQKTETKPDQEFSFLIKDLVDSKVFAENVLLGKITDVLSLPSNDVYVLEDENGKEILVPALKEIIDRFDKKEKKLYLKVEKSYFEDDEN